MRLIIIRHGETVENKVGIVQGQTNGRLSRLGREQAERLAKRLKDEKIDIAYSSDLGRCKESLGPLLKLRKIKVNYSNLLREQGKGVFEGKKRIYFDKWRKNNPGKIPEGWESWEDVEKRVANFLKGNFDKWKGKNVLIILHGGTKQTLLKILFRNDRKYRKKLEGISPNTGITIVRLEDNGDCVFDELYSTGHLENLK
jgi:phosphoserine phosphatase